MIKHSKSLAIVIVLILTTGLTIALGMPYDKLDWQKYIGAYTIEKYEIYLPLVTHNGR
jgi:hypothetical protein